MTSKTLFRLATASAVATFTLALGGIWWWALIGMTKEVSAATIWTVLILVPTSVALYGAADIKSFTEDR